MMRKLSTAWVLLVFFAMLPGLGCARIERVYDHPGRDLPVYENAAPNVVLASIQQRDEAIHGWRALGNLFVFRGGSATRLEGIMLVDALDTPSPSLRLRASKLGRNAMDLVYAEGKAWMWTRNQEDDANASDAPPIDLPLAVLRSQALQFNRQSESHLIFNTKEKIGNSSAEVWVHQPTRTIHRIIFQTSDGPIKVELRYLSGEPAPHLDALRLSLGVHPLVEFEVEEFQPNPTLNPALFKPIPGSRPIGGTALPSLTN